MTPGTIPGMGSKEEIRGRMLPVDVPEWEPLLNVAPDHVDDFMWMFSVGLKDGTRLQAYKHYWTRGYLHLDNDGRAFVFVGRERYREVAALWLVSQVVREALPTDTFEYIVRQNVEDEKPIAHWTRSATRHRVSRERSAHVVEHCGLCFRERIPFDDDDPTWRDERVLFFGPDLEGVELEVVAVEVDEEEFLVIHAMKLRERYLAAYEEARRWQK